MITRSLFFAAMLSVGGVTVASAQGAAPAQQPAEKRYHMEGKVVSLRPASKQAVIDHKTIPGYMSAMAMPYTFKDSTELAKLKVGDQIKADVVVSAGKTWVEKVVVVKDSTPATAPR